MENGSFKLTLMSQLISSILVVFRVFWLVTLTACVGEFPILPTDGEKQDGTKTLSFEEFPVDPGLSGKAKDLCAEEFVFQSEEEFNQHILPMFLSQCLSCHNATQSFGGLSIEPYLNPLVAILPGNISFWEKSLGQIESGKMPPAKALSPCDQKKVSAWVSAIKSQQVNIAPKISLQNCMGTATEDSNYSCDFKVDQNIVSFLGQNPNCQWGQWQQVNTTTVRFLGQPKNSDVKKACQLSLEVASQMGQAQSSFNVSVQNLAPVFSQNNYQWTFNEDVGVQSIDLNHTDEGADLGVCSIINNATNTCSSLGLGVVSIAQANLCQISFSPIANKNGVCKFNVQADDTNGGIATTEVQVNLAPVNDAPVWSNSICAASLEDQPFQCQLSFTDLDTEDNHQVTVLPATTCSWLLQSHVTLSGKNVSLLTAPLVNKNVGLCLLALEVKDNQNVKVVKNLTLNITNTPPTLSASNVTLPQSAPMTMIQNLQASDEDPALGYYEFLTPGGIACANRGILQLNAQTGVINFDVENSFFGICNVAVRYHDGNGSSVDQSFSVTVSNDNQSPTAQINCPIGNEGQSYSCLVSINDADSDEIFVENFKAVGAKCPIMEYVKTTSQLNVKTAAVVTNSQVGICSVEFNLKDSKNAFSPLYVFSIDFKNKIPALGLSPTSATVLEDAVEVVIANLNSDEEGQSGVSYNVNIGASSCVAAAQTYNLNAQTGVLSFRPKLNYYGSCVFNLSVNDGNGGVSSGNLTVNVTAVNDAPKITSNNCQISLQEDAVISSCNILANDPDLIAIPYTGLEISIDPLTTCTFFTKNQKLSTTGNGTFILAANKIPTNADVGACLLRLRAIDGAGGVDSIDLSYVVNNVPADFNVAAQTIKYGEVLKINIDATDEGQGSGQYQIAPTSVAGSFPQCHLFLPNVEYSINSQSGQFEFQSLVNLDGLCFMLIQYNDGHTVTTKEFSITGQKIEEAIVCAETSIIDSPPMRRLSNFEYINSINDILGSNFSLAEVNLINDITGQFDTNSKVQIMTESHVAQYLQATEIFTQKILENSALKKQIIDDQCNAGISALTCATQILNGWASKAFRRPVNQFTADEYMMNQEFESIPVAGNTLSLVPVPVNPTTYNYLISQASLITKSGIPGVVSLFGNNGKIIFTYNNEQQSSLNLVIKVEVLHNSKGEKPTLNIKYDNQIIYNQILNYPNFSHQTFTIPLGAKNAGEYDLEIANINQLLGNAADVNDKTKIVILNAHLIDINGKKIGEDLFDETLMASLQTILMSPRFLFLVEKENTQAQGDYALDAYELASRLSYFLWSSIPDATLMSKASNNSLLTPSVLSAEITRMLLDPKAERFFQSFFGTWLGYENVLTKNFDETKYPIFAQYGQALLQDMVAEIKTYLKYIVINNRPLSELLVSDYSFVSEDLGELIYQVSPSLQSPTFDSLYLVDPFSQNYQSGLLSKAAILAKLSKPTSSAIVARGHFIATKMGCYEMDPPDNIPDFNNPFDQPIPNQGGLGPREILHQQTSADSSCIGCHSILNELGGAMENYDAMGVYHEQYQHAPFQGMSIDAQAEIDGYTFQGAEGVAQLLMKKDDAPLGMSFPHCLSSKLHSFALGKDLAKNSTSDQCLVKEGATVVDNQHSFQDLVKKIVLSKNFLRKSAP
jgi:hypothetical protein